MLHVMKTFKQFTNGLRKKQKFSLLEKSIKKMVDLVCSKENANSIKWIKKKLKIGITNMLTLWQQIARQLKCISNIWLTILLMKNGTKKVRGQELWSAKSNNHTSKAGHGGYHIYKKYNSEYYPCKENMSEVDEALEWLSPYLRLLLQDLVTRDCSNTYIWLLVIFSLYIWNLSHKSS